MNGSTQQSQCHLITVEEAPEPFRRVLQERLHGPVEMMLYSPPLASAHRMRASLLAVTGTGWMTLKEAADGGVAVHHADYGDTLLLELTTILLHGTLRIDHLVAGELHRAAVEFNAAHASDYEDAVYRMLGSIDAQPGHFVHHGELDAQLDVLPLKYHNAALHYLPLGRRLLSVVHWPACLGGNHRWSSEELAPEAMLLLTDRELMLVSEERARSWLRIGQEAPRYGNIVTFLPLVRLGNCRVDAGGEEAMAVLELDLHSGQGKALPEATAADVVRVALPRTMCREVATFLDEVSDQQMRLDSPVIA